MKKELSDEIKAKLRKILALAESGFDGERVAAKNKLQALLLEHGLALEDLADDGGEVNHVFYNITDKIQQKLWAHVCFKVKDVQEISYYTRRKSERVFSCTEAQAKEIADLYKWHKRNFNKELRKITEEFLDAYLIKHKIWADTPRERKYGEQDEPVDMERLTRIMMYKSHMSNETYHKAIGGGYG